MLLPQSCAGNVALFLQVFFFDFFREQGDDKNQPKVDEEGFSIRPDNPFESILFTRYVFNLFTHAILREAACVTQQ